MKYLKFLLLAFFITLPQLLSAQEPSKEIMLDRIVAVVNDGIVLHSELEDQLAVTKRNLAGENIDLPPDDILRRQVLESLVLKQIQLQRAERLGVQVSDEEVNRSLESIALRNGMTLSQLPTALSLQGIDYNLYRDEFRKDLILQQLRARDVGSRISITRSEVDKLLAQNSDNNIEYEVLHLLISVGSDASEDEVAAAQNEAEEIFARLQEGEDFGPLAISYSDVPDVLNSHGNLGYLKANALPSIFAEKVLSMSPGETAAPIRSASGFHLVQLNDIRGVEKVITEQRKARHILIQTNQVVSDDNARLKLDGILARIRDGEDFAEIAAQESADTTSASQGGELDWASPGTFVTIFEEKLGELEKMEISEPFKSPFGWHIVQLLDTRNYDSTLDTRRNEVAGALRARKFEEESQEWVRQLRDEAYVEIRLDGRS